MTKYQRRRYICISGVIALFGASASSCSEQEEAEVAPFYSDTEITFSLSEWQPVQQSRADTYGEDDLTDPKKGGGYFTLYAYVGDKVLIDGKRGWYRKEDGKWYILNDDGSVREYYWPNSEPVDFFAYMPYNRQDTESSSDGYEKKPAYVGDYKYGSGVWEFSYKPPVGDQPPFSLEAKNNDDVREFIYACETGKEKPKQEEPVSLTFKHPFALVNFKLKAGSSRMTINSFAFEDICLDGTFSIKKESTGGTLKWNTGTGNKGKYTAEIGIRVPNDVNYGTELSDGGFIVVPQSIDDVTLAMTFTRGLGTTGTTETCIFPSLRVEWEAGYIYTYTIHYGDENEEIYFTVESEKWITGDDNGNKYQQNIDVE